MAYKAIYLWGGKIFSIVIGCKRGVAPYALVSCLRWVIRVLSVALSGPSQRCFGRSLPEVRWDPAGHYCSEDGSVCPEDDAWILSSPPLDPRILSPTGSSHVPASSWIILSWIISSWIISSCPRLDALMSPPGPLLDPLIWPPGSLHLPPLDHLILSPPGSSHVP